MTASTDPNIYALTTTLGTPGSPGNQSAWSGGSETVNSQHKHRPAMVIRNATILGLPLQSFHPSPSSAGIPISLTYRMPDLWEETACEDNKQQHGSRRQ